MSKFRIDSTFKSFGAFWDHNLPDKRFMGSIAARKGLVEFEGAPNYTELDQEALRSIFTEINSPPDLQGSKAICGFTTMNRCTLLNPLRLAGDGLVHFPTMQKVDRVRYRAMRTVMGLHLESSEANVLDSAAYYLTKIHHVLPSPWQTKMSAESMEYVVRMGSQEIFRCNSNYLAAEVSCEVFGGGKTRIKRGVRIKPITRIKISPAKPQSLDWFAKLAFRLENFFSLMLGTSVEIKRVQMFQGEQDGWLVQRVNGRKEKIDPQKWVRCTFDNTAHALERWLAAPEIDQVVELNFLETLRKKDLYQETEFLTLAQALEGFGRVNFGGKKRRAAKFDDLIGSAYNLFTAKTARDLIGELSTFTSQVIQTRDYYTHLGNPKGGSAAKTMKQLFLLNRRLRAFLRGAMLISIGIPESAFSQAILYEAAQWK